MMIGQQSALLVVAPCMVLCQEALTDCICIEWAHDAESHLLCPSQHISDTWSDVVQWSQSNVQHGLALTEADDRVAKQLFLVATTVLCCRYPGRLDSSGPGPSDPALSAVLPDGMLNAAGECPRLQQQCGLRTWSGGKGRRPSNALQAACISKA